MIASGIRIIFPNTYGICFLVFILFPLLFFWKSNIVNNTKEFILTKEKGLQLKGLFILIVIIHHISQRIETNKSLIIYFRDVGYLAVGVFFFISGFGLMKSLKTKNNYLSNFIQKRVLRIYFPFIIINILTTIILFLIGREISFKDAIEYILGIQLIDDTQWFIVTIILFYLFFYLIYSQIKKLNLAYIYILLCIIFYILLCKLTNQGGWKFVSSFCFPLGIIFAWKEKIINVSIYRNYTSCLLFTFISFIISSILKEGKFLFGWYYISAVLFAILVYIVALKFNLKSPIYTIGGIFSLEIYLLHIKILHIWKHIRIDSGLWLISYLGCLLILSFIFRKFYSFFYRRIIYFEK